MGSRFSIAKTLQRFSRDQTGSMTVEGVLWIPAYVFLMVMVADVCFVFYGQANALRLVQDANRAASTGMFTNDTDTTNNDTENTTGITDFLTTRLATNNITPSAIDVTFNNKVITTTLRIPASDLDAVGLFDVLSGVSVSVRTQHYEEF